MRYASTLRPREQNTPRTLSLYVNNTKQATVKFPNLANWEMWDLKSEIVMLNAGENSVVYQFDTDNNGDVYLDTLMVAQATKPEPAIEETGMQLALVFSLMAVVFSLFAVFMARRRRG